MRAVYKNITGALLAVGLLAGSALAQQPAQQQPAQQQPAQQQPIRPPAREPADVPRIKGPDDPSDSFLKRHEGFLKDLKDKNGKVGILFVGDSITDGWRGRGKEVFEKNYGTMDPLNIGIGGDRTQHVLWRLDHGEVEGISPTVAVLMIGTNNLGNASNENIVEGVTKIVKELNEKLPTTKVLLLAIFPRDPKPDSPRRAAIKQINEQLAKLDDGGKHVKYLDIGPKFLESDGSLSKEIMPDALHPNERGYEIWADSMEPTLVELMK